MPPKPKLWSPAVLDTKNVLKLIQGRPTELQVFFFVELHEQWGYGPTTRAEVIEATQLSENTVDKALNALAKRKFIEEATERDAEKAKRLLPPPEQDKKTEGRRTAP